MHFVVYCRRLPPHTHWERLAVCSQQPSWYLPAIHLPEGRSLCSRQAAWDPRQVRLLVPQTGGCCWCLPAPPQRREKQFLSQPVAPTVKLEPSSPVAKKSSRGSILLTSAVWTAVSCCLCDTWARPLTKKPLKTHLIQFFFIQWDNSAVGLCPGRFVRVARAAEPSRVWRAVSRVCFNVRICHPVQPSASCSAQYFFFYDSVINSHMLYLVWGLLEG